MRFLLFDKIVSYEKGKRGTGIKNVTLGEDFLIKHYDRFPIMPESLIIESLAQVGGWIISVSSNYRYAAIMVMVEGVKFYRPVTPGDQLLLSVEIGEIDKTGTLVKGNASIGDDPAATIERLVYILYEVPENLKEEIKERQIYLSGGFLSRDGEVKRSE